MKLPYKFNHGILGINARNLQYVKPFNPRKSVDFADDKLKTKAFLSARDVPSAKLYGRIENRQQLRDFDFSKLPDECVLKPNYGFGGEGIIIIKGRNKQGLFVRSNGTPITQKELFEHIEDILDGMFSINGRKDTAFFEQILVSHDCFAPFRPAGLPDIRVIVFNLVPVMAEVRIPTAQSDGKANVHLGGIGLGVDLAKGVTTHAVQYNHITKVLPGGGSPGGHVIPYWDEILLHSSRIQQLTNIGYLAVDITIDQNIGPALLEVNARAGLMVQIANLAPLRRRLEKVGNIKVASPEKGVQIAQDLFGEGGAQAEASKTPPILGQHEMITIIGDGESIDAPCLITTNQERTVFSSKLMTELLKIGAAEPEDTNESTYRTKFSLLGKKIQTVVKVESFPGTDRAQIGRRDLSGFLIDPTKDKKPEIRIVSKSADLRPIDKNLAQIDRSLMILKYIKPVNLAEERARATEDVNYNPLFQYKEPEIDLQDLEKKLENPIQDSSALGILLEKKRQELLVRIELIRSRGNSAKFTQASRALFGAPTSALMRAASAVLHNRDACDLPMLDADKLSAEEAAERFEGVLATYALHNWRIVINESMVNDVSVGGTKLNLRKGARFEPVSVEGLIAHEIETHILTAENGDHQPYAILRNGTADYLDTQEGLAVFNQNRVYGASHEKRYNPARAVLGVSFALEHSFADTRRYLTEELGNTPAKALSATISMKRGLGNTREIGGFTKSLVYFRGSRAIEQFVRDGGDIQRLYVGKINLEDLELVEQIPDLKPPLLIPSFLRPEEVVQKKSKSKKKKKTEVESDGGEE